MNIEKLKQAVRAIGESYSNDRELRARRLFIEERPASLHSDRHREFDIKTEISDFFQIPYSSVSFSGSAQLGFSIHKNKLFEPSLSDLDAACINIELFQKAWIDVISTTRAFSDLTPFGSRNVDKINLFKEQLLKRGMIRIDAMPSSALKRRWSHFQNDISRKHAAVFRAVSVAVYMNEYAFCWKQDSALAQLMSL